MLNPLFWLVLSLLLVTVSLTLVLAAALPAFRELSRAARSAEKLFDTLNRDLPPTLASIRSTSSEITDLTDEVSDGVQAAGEMVKQVDQGLNSARQQVKRAGTTGRNLLVGLRVAWRTFHRKSPSRARQREGQRPPADGTGQRRLNASTRPPFSNHDRPRAAPSSLSAQPRLATAEMRPHPPNAEMRPHPQPGEGAEFSLTAKSRDPDPENWPEDPPESEPYD